MSLVEEVVEPNRPAWLEWCEKNSQPKEYNFPRIKRELTRWQKRGPMTRRDWVRFYNWAATNAIPRELEEKPAAAPEEPEEPGKKPKKKKKKKTLNELLERIAKLCMPKWPRGKYEYPPKPVYPYSPKIHFKEPAHRDPGRPFAPPKVPKWFQHIELEIDFWNDLRFPIVRSALNYKPSAHMLELAQPRVTPPEPPHCPIPEKPIEYVPPRRRMTYRQWREHQRRLEYLAKPVVRPYYEFCYYE